MFRVNPGAQSATTPIASAQLFGRILDRLAALPGRDVGWR